MKAAQALALLEVSDFVTPDHVEPLAVPVVAHRLALDSRARFSGQSAESVVETLLRQVAPPI